MWEAPARTFLLPSSIMTDVLPTILLILFVLAGVLALWLRLPAYVYVSGLLICVIGTIVWVAWYPALLVDLVQVNVLCLAIGSAVWSLLDIAYPRCVPQPKVAGRQLPFSHFAAQLAVGLVLAVATVAVFSILSRSVYGGVARLDWIALGAAAGAVAICLWDRSSRFALAGLYALGLAAVGMQLCARDIMRHEFIWRTPTDLAGFVLVTALAGWSLPRIKFVWRRIGIPDDPRRWPSGWFMLAQSVLAAIAAMLSARIAIGFGFDGTGTEVALFGLSGRLAGTSGALMLLGATIVMAWQTQRPWRAAWQYAAMAAGVLFTGSLGWAGLDSTPGTPTGDAPWLHRSVSLMVPAAMMTLLSGFGLGAVLPKGSDWIAAGRRMTPAFGGLAIVMLAIILAQEGLLFLADPARGAPMATWAIVIVAVALVLLVAACLSFALAGKLDPLGLTDRGRTVYVYAAGVLAALAGLHLWFTVPELFRLGILEKWWMVIVMAPAC